MKFKKQQYFNSNYYSPIPNSEAASSKENKREIATLPV
jgi:hypothetical protein